MTQYLFTHVIKQGGTINSNLVTYQFNITYGVIPTLMAVWMKWSSDV